MRNIRVLEEGIIYDNPLPQLRSRHAYFPVCLQEQDGSLLAAYVLGEAFESPDLTTHLARSRDLGRTWEHLGPIYDKGGLPAPRTDFLKLTLVDDRELLAFGYCFDRSNPDLPIGNPATGGLIESELVLLRSSDRGVTWKGPVTVPHTLAGPIEASAPLVVLTNGDWVTPIANFMTWVGETRQDLQGRMLRSTDCGETWDDGTVTMQFRGKVPVWEQRACELEPGRLLVIAWNEDLANGRRLPNHFVLSNDGGRRFTQPVSTGIMGQASNVTYLGNSRVLAVHCLRRDTDKPGIYAFVVDFAKNRWDILQSEVVWEPNAPVRADRHFSDAFAFLKFGQPSVIPLAGGEYFMVHWAVSEGQGRILWHRLAL